MSTWDDLSILDCITTILADVHPWRADHHFGRPYLTAYQLAIAFRQRYPNEAAAIGLPTGGAGVGQHTSLAQYLAGQLSQRLANGSIDNIEGAFLSNNCLADVSFEDGARVIRSSLTDSQYDLSMFRLRD